MSGVVDMVLKMTLGLFVKKARSSLSNKLKDGGLNSQQLRGLIITKLEEIKTEVVGLARVNLLSSASFIQEGLGILNNLFDKPDGPTLPLQGDVVTVGENSSRADKTDKALSSGSCSPFNEDSAMELAKAINEIKINSGDHFANAMDLFKTANTEATKAFHNEALKVEDRVLAAKLRVQSRLLLSLENPSLASQPCRLYLEELHGVPSIVKVLQNESKGWFFSRFNQRKRLELVLSIYAINFVVFNFLNSFTQGPVNVYDWPTLKSGNYTYSPLIPDEKMCIELQSANIEIPSLEALRCLESRDVVVNNTGMITAGFPPVSMRWNKFAGNYKRMGFVLTDHNIWSIYHLRRVIDPRGIAEDIEVDVVEDIDQLMVLEGVVEDVIDTDETHSIGITVAKKTVSFLGLFDSTKRKIDEIMVDKCVNCAKLVPTSDGVALIIFGAFPYNERKIALYKNENGKIKDTHIFRIKLHIKNALFTVTDKYQVVAIEQSGHRIHVYEKNGQLIREFELYGGERESCVCIAFNFTTKELVFVSRVESWYFLSAYEPETGKRRHNVRLSLFGEKESNLCLTTHCSGPMVLVSDEHALHIQ